MGKCCTRRDFIRLGIGTSVAAGIASRIGQPLFAQDKKNQTVAGGKAKRCIMLWMMGAPSQIDTWDPKPGQSTGGPFKAIETSAPGIQIAEHLPLTAKQMKNISLIRTVTSKDPNHETAHYMLHTSYRRAGDVEHPHLGAVVAHELGLAVNDLPPAVVVGNTPLAGAGYLPAEYGPLVFDRFREASDDLLPSSVNPRERLEKRWAYLDRMERRFGASHEDRRLEERRKSYEKAHQVLTSDRVKAFDIRGESDDVRKAYGDTDFGNACLQARRLTEAGVRFVEVMYGDWDTHNDNFNRVKTLCTDIDRPMAALIDDLSKRRLLDDTLVLWMGEFGRTPIINGAEGRDHWTNWSVAMAGGGVKGGRVIGKTDEKGITIAERPVPVNDLYSTIYHAFGIDSSKQLVKVPRPMKIVDGGSPITELF